LQLAPSSPAAVSAGFSALRPEKSTNFSFGFVFRPIPRLVVTLDGYYIKIKDRIVSSGTIQGQQAQPFPTPAVRNGVDNVRPLINGLTPYQLVLNAIAASGKQLDPSVVQSGALSIQTYTNGIDTETKGIELSARYPMDLPFGSLDLSLGANYNETKVTASRLGNLFDAQARQIIEAASPKFRLNAGMLFKSGRFTANARMNYYSKTISYVQPNAISTTPRPIANSYWEVSIPPAAIVDLELSYDITDFANLAVGANNLFNKIPPVPSLVPDYASHPNDFVNGRSPYINNGGTLNGPYGFGPYGTNGGYYYARATFKF